jgi:hypothetical protein
MNLHVHRPATLYVRGVRQCHDCGKHARWAGFEQMWYGITSTCLNCGRTWSDGEWMPLPFERNSRQNSINRAKTMWDKAVGWRSPEAKAWFREQMDDAA